MMSSNVSVVDGLRLALPWLKLYRGATFVVKIGGSALDEGAAVQPLVDQLAMLHILGMRLVVVHGGGNQITRTAAARGITTRKIGGRRVTDAPMRDVVVEVLEGSVRKTLLDAFAAAGVEAVGLSGADEGVVKARRRAPTVEGGETVDWGFVGDVDSVDVAPIVHRLDAGAVVCMSPLSADLDGGGRLNTNADVVAANVAVALQARKLLMVSDVPGLLADPADPESLVVMTDLSGLDRLQADGALSGGMLPKVACIRTALRGGVPRAHIIAHTTEDSVLREVFTNEGAGTLVVPDVDAVAAAASV
jgi:acetylglutamate kinase